MGTLSWILGVYAGSPGGSFRRVGYLGKGGEIVTNMVYAREFRTKREAETSAGLAPSSDDGRITYLPIAFE